MDKRSLLTVGVAGLAGALGAGWAWWRFQPHAVDDGVAEHWWTLRFDTPDGASLATAAWRGKPLLVNFWATWCPPCIEELPMLNAFYREQRVRGWTVVGVAIDQPSAVRRFVQRQPLDFPVLMGGLDGTDLSKALGNESGGLPFSVGFDATGRVGPRKLGQLKPEDLADWLKQLG
jgi:thiol-disulfide isomerase/thioredoxin